MRTRCLIGAPSWVLLSALSLGAAHATHAAEMAEPEDAATRNARIDPWQGYNRSMFGFNEAVDAKVLKPVAQTYRDVLPSPVRTGVSNVLGNLGDVWSVVNHLLQGKPASASAMTLRVMTNTVFGLGGLMDPATEMGLERQSEDFGQTLGRWGVGSGPYVVLPLLGASTLRDTVALPVDRKASPSKLAEDTAGALGITALQVVSVRAGLLSASAMLDDVALDKYSFMRDAYLARRRNQVFDGNPPEDAQ
jgi:phospholipid-binding lipoprotein MlaA